MNRLWPSTLLAAAVTAVVLTGCKAGPHSPAGFRLPEGDPIQGRAAFVELQCHSCHTVSGETNLPAPTLTVRPPVILGGDVLEVKTYGELVTAIIHPAYDLSPQLSEKWESGAKHSPMGSFNEEMKVQQMIDLAAYLQPKYQKLVSEYGWGPAR